MLANGPAQNNGQEQTYHNDVLGLTFQYPAGWVIREQLSTRTVMAASKDDMEAIADGRAPAGLLFTVTISSFRLIGAQQVEDFGPILQNISQAPRVTPERFQISGVEGLALEVQDAAQDVAARTAIVSIGKRQVAVIRGVATISAWKNKAADQLDEIMTSLNFTQPQAGEDLDSFGSVLWQLPADQLADVVDLSVSADGASVFVSERKSGIWRVAANGTLNEVNKPPDIGEFGGIGVLNSGTQYIADPKSNSIWQIAPSGETTRLLGGKIGEERGEFGTSSPVFFAFGLRGTIFVLDDNEKGQRIQVFNRAGEWSGTWDLKGIQADRIDHPLISSDDEGNIYLIGRNTDGLIKLNAVGKLLQKNLGREQLAGMVPLAIAADRAENVYVATADDGILKLDAKGQLVGIIGEPYDEAAPPKPGQLGKPAALTLGEDARILYVADVGKYPQIVAFALNGNHAVNLLSGTRDAGQISYGQTVTGEIFSTIFMDNYTFQGKAKDVVTITMKAGENSGIDPFVDLIGPNGARLAANDDAKAEGLGPKDAQIKEFRLPIDGVYVIRATRFGRETTRTTGRYSLTLSLVQPSNPLTATLTRTSTPKLTATPLKPTATRTPSNTATPAKPTDTSTPSATPSTAPWRETQRAGASKTVQARFSPTPSPRPPTATSTKINTPSPTVRPSATNTATPTSSPTNKPTATTEPAF